MFSHEGNSRSDHQNRLLAGYLACVGGYVNAVGFAVIGSFTSHVTGNVGRLANDAALGRGAAALSALSMVIAFFLGAFVGSVVLESRWFGHVSRAYAVALGLEAILLLAFMMVSRATVQASPRVLDAEAAVLCAAMGIQNGLVTRLSGAVVRTTHLTGVVTDLGIEVARWFRYWRRSVADIAGVPLVLGPNVAERPAAPKILLLATIATSFVCGAFLGAFGTVTIGWPSMLLAVFAVALCSLYAILSGRRHTSGAARASRNESFAKHVDRF